MFARARVCVHCVTVICVLFDLTTLPPVVRAAAAESLPHLLECVKVKGTALQDDCTTLTDHAYHIVVARSHSRAGHVEFHINQIARSHWY